MEKTNNGSPKTNGLAKFGIAALAGLLFAGGMFFWVYRTFSPKPSDSQLANPAQKEETASAVENDSPASAAGSAATQPTYDLTGKWSGKYKVTSPKGCAGFSGSWTASLKQNGDSFSGSYTSDVLVNGVVSGKSSGAKGFSWTVTGGGGAQLKGNVTGPNSLAGNFTGPTCPGTSARTAGTFSGGK